MPSSADNYPSFLKADSQSLVETLPITKGCQVDSPTQLSIVYCVSMINEIHQTTELYMHSNIPLETGSGMYESKTKQIWKVQAAVPMAPVPTALPPPMASE